MPGIIEAPRSIVLAADMELDQFEPVISQVADVEGVGGIKIGFGLGLSKISLPGVVEIIKNVNPETVVVYDHQKASTDIPETGKVFAKRMVEAAIDAVILFPFTGPVVQEAWTNELQNNGLAVISGGDMTHKDLASSEDGESGGYVHPRAFRRMYLKAAELGVRDFVVPGNKPEKVIEYRSLLDGEIGSGNYTLWAPGFIDQGGDISETGSVAGPNFNAIVGGGIYKKENPRQAAQALGKAILGLEQ